MRFYSTPYGNFFHSFGGNLISCTRLVLRDCIFCIPFTRRVRVQLEILMQTPSCDCWNGDATVWKISQRDWEMWKKEELVLEKQPRPKMGTEHEEINTRVRLNGRMTFDRRKGPFPVFFFNNNKINKWINKNNKRLADLLIELANCSFGLSTDAFLKSVNIVDKEVRTIPFNSR